MNNSDKDFVLAIVLNYNQTDYTVSCVNSLLESDYSNLKIFLLDNGSTVANFQSLKASLPENPNLILHRLEENLGYSKGSNYAMDYCLKFDPYHFLIMNNDTIVDDQAVSELVKTSKLYGDKARVTGKVFHYDDRKRLQFICFKYYNKNLLSFKMIGVDELDQGQYDSWTELEMIDDIFVLHPVSLYKESGGYSPYLWVNGVNIDISLRAINCGYKLVFSPKAKIWHKGSVSIGGRNKNPKLAFWNIQGKLVLRYLYLKKGNFYKAYLTVLIGAVRTYVKSLFLKYFKKEDQMAYAESKLKAISYFNKWVKSKHPNDGYNPY